jgi:hypothetical protein
MKQLVDTASLSEIKHPNETRERRRTPLGQHTQILQPASRCRINNAPQEFSIRECHYPDAQVWKIGEEFRQEGSP